MITGILALVFLVIPLLIVILAIRGFTTDVRRRAQRREDANRRWRNRR